MTKTCKICGETKTVSEFFKAKNGKNGLDTHCKKCRMVKTIAYRKQQPASKINKIKRRHILKKQFGLTESSYCELLESQNNVCAICLRPETGRSGVNRTLRSLAVDHCHTTGKVRGLLCHHCNSALGQLNDSPEIFMRAIEYLKKNGS